MKGVPHLVLSGDPLKQGSDIEALCGRTIHNATWVFEEIVTGEMKSFGQMTMRVCPKCTKIFFGMDPREFSAKEYVYGMLPAIEARLGDWAEAS